MRYIMSVLALAMLSLIVTGCATVQSTTQREVQVMSKDSAFDADRQAILAMAGEYKVQFQFLETAALQDGYQLHDKYVAAATEFVFVIEDSGRQIDLQHILVLKDGSVIKHWRQLWTYEDDMMYEFGGNRTWKPRHISQQERAGTWTQAVFQVDDSPRYEGIGRWQHQHNFASWQSETTWRPLPRREYSKRSDYDVLVARNRHTLTPTGWLHEQDNYKLVLDGSNQPILALEAGLNVYTRIKDVDFSAGRVYWEKTKDYWAQVRLAWSQLMDGKQVVKLRDKVDDKPLWEQMFSLAESNAVEKISPTLKSFMLIDQPLQSNPKLTGSY